MQIASAPGVGRFVTYLDSPIGRLKLVSDGTALTGLYLHVERYPPRPDASWVEDPNAKPFSNASRQLAAYFAGQLQRFTLPLAAPGTPFQFKVWNELTRIEYGTTASYGEIARRVGNPGASRAVGLANGRNPISIIVPCHRVIGANGSLTGYGGGLERKQWLLRHEGAMAQELLL